MSNRNKYPCCLYPPMLTIKKIRSSFQECPSSTWTREIGATLPIECGAGLSTGDTLPKIPITTSKPSKVQVNACRCQIRWNQCQGQGEGIQGIGPGFQQQILKWQPQCSSEGLQQIVLALHAWGYQHPRPQAVVFLLSNRTNYPGEIEKSRQIQIQNIQILEKIQLVQTRHETICKNIGVRLAPIRLKNNILIRRINERFLPIVLVCILITQICLFCISTTLQLL